jgi:hypothetical protein
LILGHIESEEPIFAAKKARKVHRDFCLADTGGTKKEKTAAWTALFAQAKLAAAQQGYDARQDMILTANALAQEGKEPVKFGNVGICFGR